MFEFVFLFKLVAFIFMFIKSCHVLFVAKHLVLTCFRNHVTTVDCCPVQ